MKNIIAHVAVAASLLLAFRAPGFAAPVDTGLPLSGGKPVLARVNGETILLEELERVFFATHGESAGSGMPPAKPSAVLDRMINARLIVQEARNIGLNELPEVLKAGKSFEEETLRRMLYTLQVQDIREPGKKEVDRRYREIVKEVRLESLLFDREEDAKRLLAAVKEGKSFEAAAKKELSAGNAKGSAEGKHLKYSSLSPEFERVISSMKKGEISPIIPVGKQYTVLKLLDIRYPEDKAARERAKQDALQAKRNNTLRTYLEGLRAKYAKVDRKLLDSIDYDSPEPGFEKLLADKRVLATVQGGTPVTVADLSSALRRQFFHGTDRAAAGKKINSRKEPAFEDMLSKQVSVLEARKRKLDQTVYFKSAVKENLDSVLFGAFMEKVVLPDIKYSEEELKKHYQGRIQEYTSPDMVRIDGLAFREKKTAEEAIRKLRKGADFRWLKENAEGQVDPSQEKELLEFKGQVLSSRTLPEAVRKAISGASPGDYRLYEPSGGKAYYVLNLQERIPPKPVPFESVKADIEKKVREEKLVKAMKDWENRLRKASEIKIYADGKKLDRIIRPDAR